MPQGHVKIKIQGIQVSPDGQVSRTESSAEGTLREKGGKHFLLYQEKAEDGSVTKSVVKYSRESLQITRSGQISSSLIFTEGEHFRSSYSTPYGSFPVDIDTERYVLSEKEDQAELSLGYRLAVDGEYTAQCLVQMKILQTD